MTSVELTPGAQDAMRSLPVPLVARVQRVFDRLLKWPDVSGAKVLRGRLKGSHRIRTGDWRVLFRVSRSGPKDWRIVVWRIENRRDVYED
jgi:mRNA-degrading endonuclease RelE of RelBE toxin-antitoxin system